MVMDWVKVKVKDWVMEMDRVLETDWATDLWLAMVREKEPAKVTEKVKVMDWVMVTGQARELETELARV